jgi:hypothetical protein
MSCCNNITPLMADAKLRVNTRVVFDRLIAQPAFRSEFEPGENSGLVRDIVVPPYGTMARVGGRLLPGSILQTSKALEKLHEAIAQSLDAIIPPAAYASMIVPSLGEALSEMAHSINEKYPVLPDSATLVPIVFAPSGRKTEDQVKDIARVFTAIESIDGRDWLESLLNGIRHRLNNNGVEGEEIEDILDTIRTQKNLPGSQIRRFLDFLDDEALSRVRLQVTMRLMKAIAAQSKKPGFKEYVARVIQCYERFAGVEGEALMLDVSSIYGQKNNALFGEHLSSTTFYACLPVWAEWSVQLFESRTEPTCGFKTIREVSYRFRVNGMNPQAGCSAFKARLQRINDKVLSAPNPDLFVKRDIGELIFLWLVLPKSIDAAEKGDVQVDDVHKIAAKLKNDPLTTLRTIHKRLEDRSGVMDDLAFELISLLKTKSPGIVEIAGRDAERFTVALGRGVVNWEAVESIASPMTDILMKSERGEDSVEWFKHLSIASATSVKGSIASYGVEMKLRERSLTGRGAPHVCAMSRDMEQAVIPVRFVPYTKSKKTNHWSPAVPDTSIFGTQTGIEIEYDLNTLALRRVKDDDKERAEQLRAASLCAFTLVCYITLWELVRRTKAASTNPLVMTLVRLQHSGKRRHGESDAHDGNTAIYGISQALEKALARELPVKLQGLATEQDDTTRWRNRGALYALLGGQGLHFPMPGNLDRVALLTYVTRPCDTHPAHPDADGYLYVSRTYTAHKTGDMGHLCLDSMFSRLVENRQDFKNPSAILEEVARLRNAGFEHIILLSHHFGNRHVGRASERHSPHATLEFLDEAAKRFPDVHLYPLRRDVFPATRLRKRGSTESGFEVVNFSDHQAMYDEIANAVLRSLMPIYTFATLTVVGEEQRPQSGFCTYFFDVEQRLTDMERNEQVRQNILGIGEAQGVRQTLIAVLRALHFMESEKPAAKNNLLPVLDPFDWATPKTTAGAGEIAIMTRRGGRSVLLSVPALLAHVTKVLHKEDL